MSSPTPTNAPKRLKWWKTLPGLTLLFLLAFMAGKLCTVGAFHARF